MYRTFTCFIPSIQTTLYCVSVSILLFTFLFSYLYFEINRVLTSIANYFTNFLYLSSRNLFAEMNNYCLLQYCENSYFLYTYY